MQPVLPDAMPAINPSTPRARRALVPRDCQVARFSRTNLLLIGPSTDTEEMVSTLWPSDATHAWRPGQALTLPTATAGTSARRVETTLVLHEIGQLTRDQQHALSRWLESQPERVHVVSTSTAPLHLRVAAGAFIDQLYYRLNTVCVELAD